MRTNAIPWTNIVGCNVTSRSNLDDILFGNILLDKTYTSTVSEDITVDISEFSAILVQLPGDGQVDAMVFRNSSHTQNSRRKIVKSTVTSDGTSSYTSIIFVNPDWTNNDKINLRATYLGAWGNARVRLFGVR